MQVDGTSSTSASATPNSAQAAASFNTDFDAFLTLLTTQVTNQDPLAPLDSTQFVEQLATFSTLEQQVASNSHLETIANLLSTQTGSSQAALIGETVALAEVEVSGTFTDLQIASSAESGRLVVRNDAGVEVFRSAEASSWTWDGADQNGDPVAAGSYSFEVLTGGQSSPARAIATIDRVITTASGVEVGFGNSLRAAEYETLT